MRGALPRRRLPTDRRRPARRQGRPRHRHRAPGGVRHADRAELRARPHPRRSDRTASRGAAAHGATRPSASTASGCPAARCTTTTIRASASRSAWTALTTRARCVWNNALGELWRRTGPIYLPRTLARRPGVTQKRLREQVRVAYIKVAEYQRRGLVHLHVIARLDRAMPDYRADQLRPPGARFTVELLEDAVRDHRPRGRRAAARRARRRPRRAGATSSTSASSTHHERRAGRRLPGQVRDQEHRTGRRAACTAIDADQIDELRRCASTCAATCAPRSRSTSACRAPRPSSTAASPAPRRPRARKPRSDPERAGAGAPLQAMSHRETRPRPPPRRHRPHRTHRPLGADRSRRAAARHGDSSRSATSRLIAPAARTPRAANAGSAAGRVRAPARLPRPLPDQEPRLLHHLQGAAPSARAARARAAARRSPDAAQRALADASERIASFRYVGQGHLTAADALLAASAAARAREHRRAAREERAMAAIGSEDSEKGGVMMMDPARVNG